MIDPNRVRPLRPSLATIACVLATAGLPAAAQARPAAHTHCGRATVRAIVNRRHVCLHLHAPSARALARYFDNFGAWGASIEPRRLAHMRWPSLQPFVDRTMAGVPAAPTAPGATPAWPAGAHAARDTVIGHAAAAGPSGSPTQITGTPPGGFDRSGMWLPPPGELPQLPPGQSITAEVQPYESPEGPGSGAKMRTVQTFPGGLSQGLDTNRGGIVDCPDRQGLSPGEVHEGESKFQQAVSGGQTSWWRTTQSADASIVARTSDQGEITEYDMDATVTLSATAHVPGKGDTAPKLVTAHVSLRHVPVGIGLHMFADGQYLTGFTITTSGVGDTNFERWAQLAVAVLQSETDRMLSNISSGGWNGCLSMAVTPPSHVFGPRESLQVKALVSSRRTGSDTVAMDLKVKAYDGFTASPDHDVQGYGTPATFTITAPATKPSHPYVFIDAVGRQGKIVGGLDLGFTTPSNAFDIEYKGSGNFWLDRTIYDPSSGTSSEQLYQGTPSWDTTTRGVTFYPTATQWSTASDLGITEQVGGQATVTIDGSSCQTPIVDPRPGIGNMTNLRATSNGGMELILAGAYEYTSPAAGNCVFDMGPLNPGGSLTPPGSGGFDPTEATQIHLTVTKAQLDAIGPGQSLQVPVQGPADPLTLNPDCGSSGNVVCNQRLSFSGTVILTRHRN